MISYTILICKLHLYIICHVFLGNTLMKTDWLAVKTISICKTTYQVACQVDQVLFIYLNIYLNKSVIVYNNRFCMCQENVCLWNCGYTDSYITQETILNEIKIFWKLLPSVNLHMCHVQISYSFLSICIQNNGGSDKWVREGHREFI